MKGQLARNSHHAIDRAPAGSRPSPLGPPASLPARRLSLAGCIRALCLSLVLVAFTVSGATVTKSKFASTPASSGPPDLTILQCGNLIYAENQSSVCFADKFLGDVSRDTSLRVARNFCPVRLGTDAVFDFPFCVMSGNESFTLTSKERENLKKYLTHGGFLLASPGCSDAKWDKAFRTEMKLSFPDTPLKKIPMTHPLFATVHRITQLTEKNGRATMLEGLELNGRLVLVYSTEGLNDVSNAKGCCCCGGNEIRDAARVNVNVFTYAVLY